MEQKIVEDLMIPLKDYPSLYDDDTLVRAVEMFERSRLDFLGKRSLPRMIIVLNHEHEFLGVVRRRDVLRGLEPDFLISKPLKHRKKLFDVAVDPNLSELSFDHLQDGAKKRAQTKKVRSVMRMMDLTIKHDDHLLKAVYEMVDNNVSLLPVMRNEQMVGVLRSVDVFHEIAKFVLGPEKLDPDGPDCVS